MNSYELEVYKEVERWQKRFTKRPSMIGKLSKNIQTKVNSYVPEKIHHAITISVKKMVEGILNGTENFSKNSFKASLSLEERDIIFGEKQKKYKKAAALEGAGTGAGGLFLGLSDFPLLLSIKMKFLFEAAYVYGYDPRKLEERIFILYLFQLAFSADKQKKIVLDKVIRWDGGENKKIDWRTFQQEYRDYLDIAKLLQLVPGIGAVVGYFVNEKLLDDLGVVAMNGYRIRWLKEKGMSF